MSEDLKINEVKNWIEKQGNVLLVYDNAPNMEVLEDFIPQNVHIIITSRNYKVPNSIEIGVMTKTEAIKLLTDNVPKKVRNEKNFKKEAAKLVESLNYIPLAISQAAAYITETMVPLSKYLELYATERYNLLSSEVMPLGSKHEPIYVTWDISLEAIKKQKNGKKIIELLNFISFCYSKNIPKSLLIHVLFKKVDNKTEVEFNKLIGVLRQYSLINIEENSLTIHQLVSHWIKDKIKVENRPYYVKELTETIKNLYPKKMKDIENSFHKISPTELNIISAFVSNIEHFLQKIELLPSFKEKIELYNLGADAYYAVGAIEKSKDVLLKTLSIKKKNYGENHPETAKTLYNLAFIHNMLGEPLLAEKILKNVLLIYENKYGKNSVKNIKILELLSNIYHVLGKYQKRTEVLEKAIFINEKTQGKNHFHTGKLLRLLSISHFLLGDFKKVRDLLSQALEITEKYYGKTHEKIGPILSFLGWVEVINGNTDAGIEKIDKALAILEKHVVSDHIDKTENKVYAGLANYELGKFDKSVEAFLEAIHSRSKYNGPDHIWTAFAQANLALVYARLGKTEEVKLLLSTALNTFEKTTKKMPLWSAFLLSRIGSIYYMIGDKKTSISLLIRALKPINTMYGPNHIFSAIVSANLGNVYRSIGEGKKGLNLLEKALKVVKKTYGPTHPFVGKLLINISLAHSNNYKEKQQRLKEALEIFNLYSSKNHESKKYINIHKSKDYILLLPF